MWGSAEVGTIAVELVSLLQKRGLSIATAESCTGGSVAAAITSVPGCSSIMLGGVVAYHNDVKTKVLGVDKETLERYGAVSEQVVMRMVQGVSVLTGADCAVATSGIAGPGGGTVEKPVGTVWIAAKVRGVVRTMLLATACGGREYNIRRSTREAMLLLCDMINGTEE